jgi:hypothetical protein
MFLVAWCADRCGPFLGVAFLQFDPQKQIMYDLVMQTIGSSLPFEHAQHAVALGHLLRDGRKKKCLTLQNVATHTLLGVATIRRAEQGDPTVRLGVYILLAAHYDVTLFRCTPS